MLALQEPVIDQLVRDEVAAHGGGAAIGITRHGEPVYAKGFGFANLEWRMPASPGTIFPIASVSKPFTAMAVMLLVQDGVLALEDRIDAYLPSIPASLAPISVEHLLTHTSGVRNFNDGPEFYSGAGRQHVSRDDLLSRMVQLPCDFVPGAKWSYSNSGYVLLSYLIERLSGMSYGRFIQERIFGPLGMRRSLLLHDRAVIPERASPYQTGPRGIELADYQSFSWMAGAGGLASTIDDLVRFEAGLVHHTVLSEALFERMLQPVRLNDGSSYPYGLGWGVGEYSGHSIHHHTGGLNGYRGEFLRLPGDDMAVIVLANHSGFPFHKVVCSVARLLLDLEPVTKPDVELTEGDRQAAIGCFASPGGAELDIRADDGRLFASGSAIGELGIDSSGNLYTLEDPEVTLVVERDGRGSVSAVTLVVPMFAPQRFIRSPRAD